MDRRGIQREQCGNVIHDIRRPRLCIGLFEKVDDDGCVLFVFHRQVPYADLK